MKLFFRKYGQGPPLIIFHGLFGQSDNWNTLGKQFSECGFAVYLIDQRNHGFSPHSDEWNYALMSNDILELIEDNRLENVILLGHSMGGKSVMHFAVHHCKKISKLIVVDIAPKHYLPAHDDVIEALLSVNFDAVKSRKEVEIQLSKFISDFATKQFLLKNLYWKQEGKLDWRFNLKVITKNIEKVGETFNLENKLCNAPTLFIRGENSRYILDSDFISTLKIFPNAELKTIAGAGHWIHTDKPREFFETVMGFLTV